MWGDVFQGAGGLVLLGGIEVGVNGRKMKIYVVMLFNFLNNIDEFAAKIGISFTFIDLLVFLLKNSDYLDKKTTFLSSFWLNFVFY